MQSLISGGTHASNMPTTDNTFQIVNEADGMDAKRLTSASVYLDTSDLSYLLLGRLHADRLRPSQWRARLEALLHADRIRLRLSPLHLAELVLRSDLREPALRALSSTPNVYLVTTAADSVFRAELEHEHPITFIEHRFSRADLESLTFSTRWSSRSLSGLTVARIVKTIVRLEARARAHSKAAQRSDVAVDKTQVRNILRGDVKKLPWWARPGAVAFSRFARWLPSRMGLPPDIVERLISEESRGLGWAATTAPLARLPRKDGRKWKHEDAQKMPATVLRACIENVHADPNRPPDDGTRYDVEHLAFVAYSDFSTIDGANFDAVKPVLRHMPHRRVFRTGNLDPVLDAMEKVEERRPASDPSE